jgi:dodecin
VAGTVARVTEISASSDRSFEDAIQIGIDRANRTLRNVSSAWVKEQKITLDGNGAITGYVVHLLVTFVLDS